MEIELQPSGDTSLLIIGSDAVVEPARGGEESTKLGGEALHPPGDHHLRCGTGQFMGQGARSEAAAPFSS